MAFLCFGVIIMFENLMLLHNNYMLIAIFFLSPSIPILYHRIIRNLNVNINSSDNLVTGTKEVYKLLEYEKEQFLSLKFKNLEVFKYIYMVLLLYFSVCRQAVVYKLNVNIIIVARISNSYSLYTA